MDAFFNKYAHTLENKETVHCIEKMADKAYCKCKKGDESYVDDYLKFKGK